MTSIEADALSETYAVVLAGGSGTRLWPLSRKSQPKQFLQFSGAETLLEATVRRLRGILPAERILILTKKEYEPLVRRQAGEVPPSNVLIEPSGRGTGPALVLASLLVQRRCRDAVLLAVPSDHVIMDEGKYLEALGDACRMARGAGMLVAIGLTPEEPSSQYGYLLRGEPWPARKVSSGVFRVDRFVEKPSLERAKEFYASGAYRWNIGTFAWSLECFRLSLERAAPELARGSASLEEHILPGGMTSGMKEAYDRLPLVSIDYALLQNADNILMVEGAFRRIDAGNLRSLQQLLPLDKAGNSTHGTVVTRQSRGNTVYSSGPLVALMGVDDVLVIATGDIVLVCGKNDSERVSEILGSLDAEQARRYS